MAKPEQGGAVHDTSVWHRWGRRVAWMCRPSATPKTGLLRSREAGDAQPRRRARRTCPSCARRRHRRVAVPPIAAVVVALVMTSSTAGASSAPSYPGDFPDPDVVAAGGTYFAFSTQVRGASGWVNVPVLTSPDGRTGWAPPTRGPDALPVLPTWARAGNTWAPSVLRSPTTGQFVLYYTVTQRSTGLQCVSRATASVASGPYLDTSSGPLVCQTALGGSIDPDPFEAPSGKLYLLWKSDDNRFGHATSLWARRMTADGLGFAAGSAPTRLLSATASWEQGIIEGPAMTAVATGPSYRYYLFYGAGPWDSPDAGIGYASCSGPLGPCTKVSVSSPWLTSGSGATAGLGPAGPDLWTPIGASATGTVQQLTYHAWSCPPGTTCTAATGYGGGAVRSMWTDTVDFSSGSPVIP